MGSLVVVVADLGSLVVGGAEACRSHVQAFSCGVVLGFRVLWLKG